MKSRLLSVAGRIERAIVSAEVVTIVTALALMLIAVTVGIIDRTFALPWPDLSEVALIAMSVIAFIGGAYAVYIKGHITVDIRNLVPHQATWRLLSVIVDLAVLLFSLAILRYAGSFMQYVVAVGERTPELELPIAFPVGCLIVGAVLSIFHVTCRLFRLPGAPGPVSEGPTVQ